MADEAFWEKYKGPHTYMTMPSFSSDRVCHRTPPPPILRFEVYPRDNEYMCGRPLSCWIQGMCILLIYSLTHSLTHDEPAHGPKNDRAVCNESSPVFSLESKIPRWDGTGPLECCGPDAPMFVFRWWQLTQEEIAQNAQNPMSSVIQSVIKKYLMSGKMLLALVEYMVNSTTHHR